MVVDMSAQEFVHCTIWFKDEATYIRFQELCPDMPSPYAQWLKLATEQIGELKRQGIIMNKVEADADEFAAWCKVRSYTPDSTARRMYAPIKFKESQRVSEN